MKASHRNTLESIPWMVTGRLSDEDRRTHEKHMSECAECRNEFALQQKVRDAMTNETPRVDYAPGASLQKLWTRIGAAEQLVPPPRNAHSVLVSRLPRFRLTHWLAAAVVVEAVGITMLAVRTPLQTTVNVPPSYITVADSQLLPQSAILRVVFAGDLSVNEMGALLQAQRLAVVDGPKPGGIYTLATTNTAHPLSATFPGTLAALRANPKVRLAEPVGRALELTARDMNTSGIDTSDLASEKAEKQP